MLRLYDLDITSAYIWNCGGSQHAVLHANEPHLGPHPRIKSLASSLDRVSQLTVIKVSTIEVVLSVSGTWYKSDSDFH